MASPTPPPSTKLDLESASEPHHDRMSGEEHEYPEGMKLVLILTALMTSVFLVALDRLIISTAIPQITDDFKSVTDIGWYGSVYLLGSCSFQLMFGKLYSFWNIKIIFLTSVLLFEIGSAVCGAAPYSAVFITGRAIAGIGAGGIFSGAIIILVHAVPLHRRPMFQGLFGAIFGIASVVGPIIGGVFTTELTWRWCFYINLPFGGLAVAIILLLLDIPEEHSNLGLWQKLWQLDFPGTSVFIPGMVSLILALQWAGVDHAWNSAVIEALLSVSGILLLVFVAVQVLLPETATIPPRVLRQRSILASFWVIVCVGSSMMVFVYFLPLWFQVIQGVSAVDSGIKMLPMVLALVVATGASGLLVSRVGYYTPVALAGIAVMSIGAGLLTTLRADTPPSRWIGYMILYGFGLGAVFQVPNIAAQTVLERADVPMGTALIMFGQLLGGAVFIAAGQNILNNQLLLRLGDDVVGNFDPSRLKTHGATTILDLDVDDSARFIVLDAYNEALRHVFQVGLILVCLSMLGAVFLEWQSVNKNKTPAPDVGQGVGRQGTTAEQGLPTTTVNNGSKTEAEASCISTAVVESQEKVKKEDGKDKDAVAVVSREGKGESRTCLDNTAPEIKVK